MTRGALAPVLVALALVACGPPKQADTPPPPDKTPAPPGSTAPAAKTEDPSADLKAAEDAITAKDFAKAKKAVEAALAKAPKNADAHYLGGLAAEGAGDKAGAEAHYRDALKLAPGLLDAGLNLAALLLDAGKAQDAVGVLKPFVAKVKDKDDLAQTYAFALGQAGDHQGAADEYEKLAKKPGADPKLALGLIDELLALGKKEDAAKHAKAFAEKADGQRDLLSAYARRLGQAAAFADAIAVIDKAIKLKSGADLLTYRALFKRSQKDLKGAQADLDAATKEDPKFQPAWVYLGEVLEDAKKPADAKKAFQKAVELGADTGPGKRAQQKLDALGSRK